MLMVGGMMLTVTIVAAQTPHHSSQDARHPTTAAGHEPTREHGPKVFEENCSRCHNAPEGFPPSISGTIATHMRVRAGLSEADYKALLRYLNP
jgi:cytochrome c5